MRAVHGPAALLPRGGKGRGAPAAGGGGGEDEEPCAAAPLALLMMHIGQIVGAGRLRATMLRIDRMGPSTPDGFSIIDRRFVTCAVCRSWGVLRTFCFTCGAPFDLAAGQLAPKVPRCGKFVERLRKRVCKVPAAAAASKIWLAESSLGAISLAACKRCCAQSGSVPSHTTHY